MNKLKGSKYLIVAMLGLSLAGCRDDARQSNSEEIMIPNLDCPSTPDSTSLRTLSELVATPLKFDGQKVKVSGYYYSSFEHSAIYPTERDPDTTLYSAGIWVNGRLPFDDFSGRHVIVSGTFSASSKGHLGQWSGSICATKIENAGSG